MSPAPRPLRAAPDPEPDESGPREEELEGGAVRVHLQPPLAFAKRQVDHLDFRPMKGKHAKGIPLGGNLLFDHMMIVAGRLCSEPTALIEELSGANMEAVLAVTNRFLERFLPTTGRSSAS